MAPKEKGKQRWGEKQSDLTVSLEWLPPPKVADLISTEVKPERFWLPSHEVSQGGEPYPGQRGPYEKSTS